MASKKLKSICFVTPFVTKGVIKHIHRKGKDQTNKLTKIFKILEKSNINK